MSYNRRHVKACAVSVFGDSGPLEGRAARFGEEEEVYMRGALIGRLLVVVAALLLVMPVTGWAGQKGIDTTLVEKAVNPFKLSSETRKAEQFKAENKAMISTDMFNGIRDIVVGLLHPAQFGKEMATLEAKPVSSSKGIDTTLVEKAANPFKLSTETMKAEQFKAENKAKVSTDFFEGIRDIVIGFVHPAQFGADMAKMPKTK